MFSKEVIPIVLHAFRKPNRVVFPYSWLGHIPFAFYLVHLCRPRIIVELGTHTGNSFSAFCQAVKEESLNTQCFAIDTWEGDEHAGYYGDEVYEELTAYHADNYEGISQLIRTTFDEASIQFSEGSIDILHIDGLHTYDAVKNDFYTWRSRMSDRGVVLFHDTNVHERGFGVNKFWEEISGDYISFNFLHSHGLGVLCVGDNVPTKLLNFIQYANLHKDEILELFFRTSLVYLSSSASAYQRALVEGDSLSIDIVSELFIDEGNGFAEPNKLIKRAETIANDEYYVSFDLHRYEHAKAVRFDPSHNPVVIKNFVCLVTTKDGIEKELTYEKTNSVEVEDGSLLFGEDPYLEFQLLPGVIRLQFRFTLEAEDNKYVNEVVKTIRSANEHEKEHEKLLESVSRTVRELNLVMDEKDRLKRESDKKGEEIALLMREKERLSTESERKSDEIILLLQEQERLSEESERKSDEVTLIMQENVRLAEESERKSERATLLMQEKERLAEESERRGNEITLVMQEKERLAEESDRRGNEITLLMQEKERLAEESGRRGDEITLLMQEKERLAEMSRKKNEEIALLLREKDRLVVESDKQSEQLKALMDEKEKIALYNRDLINELESIKTSWVYRFMKIRKNT